MNSCSRALFIYFFLSQSEQNRNESAYTLLIVARQLSKGAAHSNSCQVSEFARASEFVLKNEGCVHPRYKNDPLLSLTHFMN